MTTVHNQRDSTLSAALDYANRGWPVFPVEPCGKRPLGWLVPHGLKHATDHANTIEKWWRLCPEANIGLTTGLAFDVLDIDGDEGHDTMNRLCGKFEMALPPGPTSITGGGFHHLFLPTGLGNRAGFATKVDWRGKGGYIVAPPSMHANGHEYAWVDDEFGPDCELEPVPDWLLFVLDPPVPVRDESVTIRNVHGISSYSLSFYAASAFAGELDRLYGATVGERNATLNRCAYSLGQLVGAGALAAETTVAELMAGARHIGLGEKEAERTIISGLCCGMANPRRLP